MNVSLDPIYAVYFMIFLAVAFLVQAVYLSISENVGRRRQINERLREIESSGDAQAALLVMRKKHGLSAEGGFALPVIWLNRLIVQSGMKIGAGRILLGMAAFTVAPFFLLRLSGQGVALSALVAVGVGGLLPFAVLVIMKSSRQKKFSAQLPDSIDIIVRSLRAGHPVPVAINLVGRERPDPIGSEFGIASDELTYGMTLETVLKNLGERVGIDDLNLLIIAVSIQSVTGGNLAEVLSNLSHVIRERFRMRRKVSAITAEGRMSAIGLSALPFVLFGVIQLLSPGYYGEIWSNPLTQPTLTVAVAMTIVGNLIMLKMVNFKF
jgi:tight adherence protein B